MCIRELPDPTRREEQVVLVTNAVFRGLVRRCLQREPGTRPTMQGIIDELKDANVTLDFTIFTGSEHRALFNFQSTGIQIVGNTQIKARATPHYLNDWNRLRAHITRNYQ